MEALWDELGLPACGPTVSNFDLGVHAHLYGSVISKAHPGTLTSLVSDPSWKKVQIVPFKGHTSYAHSESG